jgi:hypothetical protein
MDASVQPFVAQAVEQSEESVRLAEGAIALLNLMIAAVGTDGNVRITEAGRGSVSIQSSEADSIRAARALQALGSRSGFTAESRGAAVILSIPDTMENKE